MHTMVLREKRERERESARPLRPRMRFIGPDAFYSPQDRWRGSKGGDATMRNPVQLNAYCSHIFESIQPLDQMLVASGTRL